MPLDLSCLADGDPVLVVRRAPEPRIQAQQTAPTLVDEELRPAPDGALVLGMRASDYLAGQPAVTDHAFGAGDALYVDMHVDGSGVATRAGLKLLPRQAIPGVEVSTRRSPEREVMFLMNHDDQPHMLRLDGEGTDAFPGDPLSGEVTRSAREARIVARPGRGSVESAEPGTCRLGQVEEAL